MFGITSREQAALDAQKRAAKAAAKAVIVDRVKAAERVRVQAVMARAQAVVAQRRVEMGLPPIVPSPISPAVPGMSYDDGKIFGLPKMVVIGGGVAAVVVVVLAMRKKK